MSYVDEELRPGLLGSLVSKAESLHGYFQLFFSDGQILTVYNRTNLGSRLPQFLHDVVGKSLQTLLETDTSVELAFESNLRVTIDLTEGQEPPEAMTLHRPHKPIVVWHN